MAEIGIQALIDRLGKKKEFAPRSAGTLTASHHRPRHDRTPTPVPDPDRRAFVASAVALAGTATAQPKEGDGPLIAYVGTFSSPFKDVLPTQVDLPPGNGRGIHVLTVDRTTGAMTAAGVHEMGTSPSHLAVSANGTRLYSTNETDRQGDTKEGTVSAFADDWERLGMSSGHRARLDVPGRTASPLLLATADQEPPVVWLRLVPLEVRRAS